MEKRSTSEECLACFQGESLVIASGQGCERGAPRAGRGAVRAPLPPHVLPPPGSPALERLARRLAERLRSALPDGTPAAAVRCLSARIQERGPHGATTRTVRAAEALLGDDPLLPLWSRATLLVPRGRSWPSGFLGAVRRAAGAIALPRSSRGPEEDGPWLLDVFAAADLLRLAAGLWAAAEPGHAAATPALDLLERLPPGAAPNRPGAARVIVRGGRITGIAPRPRASGGGWREADRAGWAGLELRLPAGRSPARVGRAVAVTRAIPLAGLVAASGVILERGRPVRRWGPTPLPDVAWWWRHAAAAAGRPVLDASGVPVLSPAVWISAAPPLSRAAFGGRDA